MAEQVGEQIERQITKPAIAKLNRSALIAAPSQPKESNPHGKKTKNQREAAKETETTAASLKTEPTLNPCK